MYACAYGCHLQWYIIKNLCENVLLFRWVGRFALGQLYRTKWMSLILQDKSIEIAMQKRWDCRVKAMLLLCNLNAFVFYWPTMRYRKVGWGSGIGQNWLLRFSVAGPLASWWLEIRRHWVGSVDCCPLVGISWK